MWPQQRLQRLLLVQLFVANACAGFLEGWWEVHRTLKLNERNVTATLSNSPQEVDVVRYDQFSVNYTISGVLRKCVNLTLTSTPKLITTMPPAPQRLCPKHLVKTRSIVYVFNTTKEGIVTLETNAEPSDIIFTDRAFVSLSVKIEPYVDTISDIVGWVYTVAWDISFLPQILHNWRRKSVVGLSFDFLTFNFIGFTCYFFFNAGLYWIDAIQDEYYERHPTSVLHVRLNDVIFPLYATICVMLQIIQCFLYDRGTQRVSTTCRIISCLLLLSIGVYAILVGTVSSIWWLDFLYWLSYVKLIITCIKYTPQLYVNYKHKSTAGWSIWQVILDFTGGSLSLLQMFLLAYNYDDYHSVLTDPTKFGLGLLSIFFNIFFFMQHYCLYRNNEIKNTEKEPPAEKEKQEIESTKL